MENGTSKRARTTFRKTGGCPVCCMLCKGDTCNAEVCKEKCILIKVLALRKKIQGLGGMCGHKQRNCE